MKISIRRIFLILVVIALVFSYVKNKLSPQEHGEDYDSATVEYTENPQEGDLDDTFKQAAEDDSTALSDGYSQRNDEESKKNEESSTHNLSLDDFFSLSLRSAQGYNTQYERYGGGGDKSLNLGNIDYINYGQHRNYENKKEENLLKSQGWEATVFSNGDMPPCYNFTPKRGKISNYLRVYVGGNTDVAIKVMDLLTHECIRYVFINSHSMFEIRNIPEGQYYLKIAYGKGWYSKVENGQCIGKFARNAIYEQGEEVLDFNVQHSFDGSYIPSYELQLDVISSSPINSFESHKISEFEFNQ
ncbi:MAG: hypothetical protein RML72_10025 [Bacteroidia bacterium]|nr:hypothetical protein [Bacteroidia bacterium]MDW8159194.1 hypothetical protein [Bacteroidia bacterium]